jgi:hypothetical protein
MVAFHYLLILTGSVAVMLLFAVLALGLAGLVLSLILASLRAPLSGAPSREENPPLRSIEANQPVGRGPCPA